MPDDTAGLELVDVQDSGDLGHESEVATGDPGDGAGRFGVVGDGRVEG